MCPNLCQKLSKTFASQVIGLVIRGSTLQTKRRCDKEEGRQEVLRHAPCALKVTYIDLIEY